MQIVRTEIAKAVAPGGELVTRVQFCGEGGECVTVDMAEVGDAGNDNEDALTRAKAILVQTAAFGRAANDYESQSNGNFDEVAITTVQHRTNEIYIFEYRDGEGSRKVPPSKMPSLEAAREEAVRGAIDLLVDLPPESGDHPSWLVRVWDEDGELVCAIDAHEAEAARRAS